ncbi:carboxylating nicotinate-nucleotide diphosphorylase [soil metagenome]
MSLDDSVHALITAALDEDVGAGDWTTLWTVAPELHGSARIIAKAEGVIAGTEVAREVFRRIDPDLRVEMRVGNAAIVQNGELVMVLSGRAASILTAERVALNFLQRLSGTATITRRYVEAVKGTGARILDTRKTTPGMRALEKAAVKAGGGENHRFGLHDMVLIKENHIAAAGGIKAAVEDVRRANLQRLKVEVEVTSLDEVAQALEAGVDRVLLDNMPLPLLREAVRLVRAAPVSVETEASGGVTLSTVRSIAECGVDFVSVGALTHSAPALDLSLLLDR